MALFDGTYSNKFERGPECPKRAFYRERKVLGPRSILDKRSISGTLTNIQFMLKEVAIRRKMEENPLKKEMT